MIFKQEMKIERKQTKRKQFFEMWHAQQLFIYI